MTKCWKPTCWLAQRCMDSLWPSGTEMNSSRSQRALKVIENRPAQVHRVFAFRESSSSSQKPTSLLSSYNQYTVGRGGVVYTDEGALFPQNWSLRVHSIVTLKCYWHVSAVTLWKSIMILSFLQCHNAWVSRAHMTLLNEKLLPQMTSNY